MPNIQAWPEQLVLSLDGRSLRGYAKLQRADGALQVFVPYTGRELTRAALAQVSALTRNLKAHVTLLAVHTGKPDVRARLEQKLAAAAERAGTQADIRIVFARDLDLGCQQVLMPNSLVVIATKKRWWPTAEVKLAGVLARAGHSVALLEV